MTNIFKIRNPGPSVRAESWSYVTFSIAKFDFKTSVPANLEKSKITQPFLFGSLVKVVLVIYLFFIFFKHWELIEQDRCNSSENLILQQSPLLWTLVPYGVAHSYLVRFEFQLLDRGSDYYGLKERHLRHEEIMNHVESRLSKRGELL